MGFARASSSLVGVVRTFFSVLQVSDKQPNKAKCEMKPLEYHYILRTIVHNSYFIYHPISRIVCSVFRALCCLGIKGQDVVLHEVGVSHQHQRMQRLSELSLE